MSDETPPIDPPAPKPPRRRRTTPTKAAAPRAKRKVAAVEADAAAEVAAPKPKAKRASSTAPRRRAKAADATGAAPAKPKRVRKPKVVEVAVAATAVEPAPPPVQPADDIAMEPPVVEPVTVEVPAAGELLAVEEHGLAHGECPADLPGAARNEAGGVRWAASILAVSSPLLLLFNSHAIDNWARQLPVTNWSAPVIDAATRWHATMQRIGFAAPVDGGRAAWKRFKDEDGAE